MTPEGFSEPSQRAALTSGLSPVRESGIGARGAPNENGGPVGPPLSNLAGGESISP
jgi:hypothetical protein